MCAQTLSKHVESHYRSRLAPLTCLITWLPQHNKYISISTLHVPLSMSEGQWRPWPQTTDIMLNKETSRAECSSSASFPARLRACKTLDFIKHLWELPEWIPLVRHHVSINGPWEYFVLQLQWKLINFTALTAEWEGVQHQRAVWKDTVVSLDGR